MNTFIRFFYEFISIFFDGFFSIFAGLVKGLGRMFNYKDYAKIINNYKETFQGPEWIFVVVFIGTLLIVFVIVGILIFLLIRKILKLRRSIYKEDDLLYEITNLNEQVGSLVKEKEEILAMKISQLGLKPDESNIIEGSPVTDEEGIEVLEEEEGRFPKLKRIDKEYENSKIKNYNNSFTLNELADNFRHFSATQLNLFYDIDLLRFFISGLSCSRLIILQGISGTGKTSLAYAWGKFVNRSSCVAAVQPSWRDKTELLGYFNEFTKKFNETEVLAYLYESRMQDNVNTIILDEMNIARVEYYFAEMLSILEMPTTDEWIVELVTSGWPGDPKQILKGKFLLPDNLWYVGTLNNDDSTFSVTDKVYDRSMPLDINKKSEPFDCPEQEAMDINYTYLKALFTTAKKDFPLSEKNDKNIKKLDEYVVENFRVAFGNRVMNQMTTFLATYVATGGTEVEAIDYFIAKKIFRKFDQLNIALIREEIDPLIKYMDEVFGKGAMKECTEYVLRLKKGS